MMRLLRIIVTYGQFTSLVARTSQIRHINTCRFYSSMPQHKKEKNKLRTYVAGRYMKYLQSYSTALEKRFPAAMKMYRLVTVGIKEFYSDVKDYVSLCIKINHGKGFSNVSRKEIELYHKMPSDMWRITPVLLLSAIPFGNYVVFPLAFLKPRKLLCSHFWTTSQTTEFNMLDLKERFKYNKPILKVLQTKLNVIVNDDLKHYWKNILATLGSGFHPKDEEIIKCKQLFVSGPFNIENISFQHAGYLLEIHGLRKGLFRKNKLRYHALIIKEMDKAIIREGGVEVLSMESLRNACFIRGLHTTNLSKQDMSIWLEKWLNISFVVDSKSYSLLLHCPILLAYNHPNNRSLIYS